jgi:hypothetical protein
MIYLMFLILCFLIIAYGHKEPEKKGILDGIDTSDREYDPDWIKNYGKPESKLGKPKATTK